MEANQSIISFSERTSLKVALIGNPNSGKSTLFNALTGLHQKTGNFPGVTVDKKSGYLKLNSLLTAEFIDLPGTYSLYPKSLDERVAFDALCNPESEDYPDVTIIVADASNLKRNLFLVSQIIDLKMPVILALNMMDLVEKEGDVIDIIRLSEKLGVKVVGVSARSKEGLKALKQTLLEPIPVPQYDFIDVKKLASELIDKITEVLNVKSDFEAFQIISNFSQINFPNKNSDKKNKIAAILNVKPIDYEKLQSQEAVERYRIINRIVEECITHPSAIKTESFTHKLDSILTHRVWGYVIFLTVLFFIFQSIFFWHRSQWNG